MVSMDKAVGSLLLGTYFNSALLVMEILQLAHYFRHMNKNDGWMINHVVGIAAFVNLVDTFMTYHSVYLYTVTYWGNVQYLAIQNWPIVVHFVATGFVGTLVQGFMLYRFWRMTQHSITVAILGLFSLASFAGSIGTAVDTSLHPFFSQRGSAGLYVTLWLISGMVADVGIAASLVWRLHRVKTDNQPMKGLLRRLITSAISTGTSTSVIAVIAVFAYLHEPSSNVPVSVTFILGRVYSCTMLYLLNNRSQMRGEMPDGTVEVGLATTFNLGGIYINRTAVITDAVYIFPNASVVPPPETDLKDQPFAGLVDVNDLNSRRSCDSTFSTSSSVSNSSSESESRDTITNAP
ncbi:hypothetical protein B0H17DRAFT_1334235 [Mycena rosella]|uniref:DUF6534 domain-containing protein n=1 Tax=Mycena rosella TaxID=1033263 RepID=A0AAD7D430_MYCRO|nr:hypothetical protein B0H17DRAFT_1334235 [Mycena rosella]